MDNLCISIALAPDVKDHVFMTILKSELEVCKDDKCVHAQDRKYNKKLIKSFKRVLKAYTYVG